jgi:hypothetical protein
MQETLKVTCPHCESILVVSRRDGTVLEVRRPLLKDSTGDRFEDAMKKVKGRGVEIEAKVQDARKQEEERRKGADEFFKEALKRAEESKDDQPLNPLDLD